MYIKKVPVFYHGDVNLTCSKPQDKILRFFLIFVRQTRPYANILVMTIFQRIFFKATNQLARATQATT